MREREGEVWPCAYLTICSLARSMDATQIYSDRTRADMKWTKCRSSLCFLFGICQQQEWTASEAGYSRRSTTTWGCLISKSGLTAERNQVCKLNCCVRCASLHVYVLSNQSNGRKAGHSAQGNINRKVHSPKAFLPFASLDLIGLIGSRR